MRSRIPLVIASIVAWAILLLGSRPSDILEICSAATWSAFSLDRFSVAAAAGFPALLWEWVLMVVAMMAPMLGGPTAHVRARSLPYRRLRAVAVFLIGYCLVWIVFGLPIAATIVAIRTAFSTPNVTVAIVLVIAFTWQCSPAKQLCLNGCHTQPPLVPNGVAADLSVFRFGVMQGIWCCGACWAIMMISLAVQTEHIVAMAVLSVFLYAERLNRPQEPIWTVRLPSAFFRLLRYRLAAGASGAPHTYG
ncbi:DUF2182 domain-containing protein [Bradyrhizobium sp. LMG 9283]|uniref:copper chaperone n=1 Tax=Bradyrhizobium sp. LMG 9283 TaxID=592064 RepID=UPI00388DCA5B